MPPIPRAISSDKQPARYDGHFHSGAFPEPHDGAFPAHAFYLGNRCIDGSLPVVVKLP